MGMCSCVCAQVNGGPEEGIRSSGAGGVGGCELPDVDAELHRGPLEVFFSTEPCD